MDDFLVMALSRWCPLLESLAECRAANLLSQNGLKQLAAQCPRLRHLNLSHWGTFTPLPEVHVWDTFLVFPQLCSVNLTFVKDFNDAMLAALAQHSKHLRDLSISHTRVSGRGVRLLAEGIFPKLNGLGIGGLSVDRAALNDLLSSAAFAQLQTMCFYANGLSAADLQQIHQKGLALSKLALEDDGGEFLEDFSGDYHARDLEPLLRGIGNRLEALDVGPIFDDTAAHVMGTSCQRLRHFAACFPAPLTDLGLVSILDGCPCLESLDVPHLESLSLFGRRWAAGPLQFARLLKNKGTTLKWVTVHGCSLRCLNLLQRTRPMVFFHHDGHVEHPFEYDNVDWEHDYETMCMMDSMA